MKKSLNLLASEESLRPVLIRDTKTGEETVPQLSSMPGDWLITVPSPVRSSSRIKDYFRRTPVLKPVLFDRYLVSSLLLAFYPKCHRDGLRSQPFSNKMIVQLNNLIDLYWTDRNKIT